MMRICQAACVVFFATFAIAFQPDFELICAMPPKKGPCTHNLVERWYHNPKSGSCETFIYGGCGGNFNRYRTEAECRKECIKEEAKWTLPPAHKTWPPAESDRCQLPKEEGSCNRRRWRYYYHAGSHSCKRFRYGGCEGNANRFRTAAACRKACIEGKGTSTPRQTTYEDIWTWTPWQVTDNTGVGTPWQATDNTGTWTPWQVTDNTGTWTPWQVTDNTGTWTPWQATDNTGVSTAWPTASDYKEPPTAVIQEDRTIGICLQPLNVGFCSKEEKRFYYDAKNHTCKPFIYGGCAGNDNNFPTREICLKMCNRGWRPTQIKDKFQEY